MKSVLRMVRKNFLFSIVFLCIFSCSMQTFSSKETPMVVPWPMYSPMRTTSEEPGIKNCFIPSDFAVSEAVLGTNCEILGKNLFRVSTKFRQDSFVAQKTDCDCWAACTVMLLNHEFGKNTSHLDIQRKITDLRLQSTMQNDFGIYCKMINGHVGMTYSSPVASMAIVTALIQNHPLLAGLEWSDAKNSTGHVYVLVGFDFSVGVFMFSSGGLPLPLPTPAPVYDKFYLIDPFKKEFKVVEMPAEEFVKKVKFVAGFFNLNDASLQNVQYNVIGDLAEYARYKSAVSKKDKGQSPEQTPENPGSAVSK